MERRQAHFPGRAPIDAYGNGGFRFADMSHRGSLLLLPDGISGWDVKSAGDLVPETFTPVFDHAAAIQFLLLGTGAVQVFPSPEIRAAFVSHGIGLEVMDTGAACRTYNLLLSEKRDVAAALIAVD